MDHYASLGVSRTSEDVVIRAAYLALMRRYHPDGNPSPEAAERVRAITTAFAVLGDEAKRREYDRGRELGAPLSSPYQDRKLRAGPLAFGVTILFMALLVWIISARMPPSKIVGGASAVSERAAVAGGIPAEINCLSTEAKDLSRREIVRQAVNLRQGNETRLAVAPDAIMVRTSPALTMTRSATGLVECSAAVTIMLPPSSSGVDSTPALSGNAEFVMARNERGDISLVELDMDDRFLLALAALRPPRPAAGEDPDAREELPPVRLAAANSEVAERGRRSQQGVAKSKVAPARSAKPAAPGGEASEKPIANAVASPGKGRTAAPKSDTASCAVKNSSGNAQCGDANVRLLEQQLAIFERQSLANAGAAKRDALRQSRNRFDLRRRSCRTPACTRRSILAQTMEIADIMRSGAPAPTR